MTWYWDLNEITPNAPIRRHGKFVGLQNIAKLYFLESLCDDLCYLLKDRSSYLPELSNANHWRREVTLIIFSAFHLPWISILRACGFSGCLKHKTISSRASSRALYSLPSLIIRYGVNVISYLMASNTIMFSFRNLSITASASPLPQSTICYGNIIALYLTILVQKSYYSFFRCNLILINEISWVLA
jgi:hypothetical protein